MIEAGQTAEEQPAADTTERAAPIAHVDLDRFCSRCTYNLRTLPVERDGRTGIPVVRCPECGTFHPANELATALRPWLRRVGAIALGGWILLLLFVFFWLGMAEGATTYGTVRELTTSGGATQITRINNQVIRTYSSGYGPLEVRELEFEDKCFVAFMLALGFVSAFVSAMVAVLVFPHWRHGSYLVLVLPLVLAANMIAALMWHYDAPHLLSWSVGLIVTQTCVQLLGGIIGIRAGRPLARLGVRVFLPPRARPHLAYIWLADNKPFPRSLGGVSGPEPQSP